MSKRCPDEQRERAVKMVLDHLDEHPSPLVACTAIAPKLGVGVEPLRTWTRQALIDADKTPGVTTAMQQWIKDLERKVGDPREANEILKSASIFFVRELTLAAADLPVHRSRIGTGKIAAPSR